MVLQDPIGEILLTIEMKDFLRKEMLALKSEQTSFLMNEGCLTSVSNCFDYTFNIVISFFYINFQKFPALTLIKL